MNQPSHTYKQQKVQSPEEKAEHKSALQSALGWPKEARLPLICIPTELTDALGGNLLLDLLPGLLSLPVQILIRGCGNASYGNAMTALQKEYEHKIAIIPNTEKDTTAMLLAADIAVFCSDPQDVPELKACMGAGVIPVTPKTSQVQEYNPIQENGYAFFYQSPSHWHAFAAVVRAIETYRFPYDWRTIQKECIKYS
ncbi:hypothetical protein COU77_03705 [Candidatus Peregrinibacteria bacterium CG10_big_fil_rev_8_21_14_0_10_49_16]|nr:MAG: hypothetical protein COW95_03115 [Candidatus Peregrinibacteria bacterium CG22_combo_CG10-13_8_21_14_all_49_11]PIR51812.1 MAG: hypothetical protein COU77_03705 [Candidatus Peregrinibacteria bacterium CG10_big_fil_rev_8_21_14_0_10_49_16]